MRQFVDFRSSLDAANDVDGTGVDRALVNTQTASAETRTGRDPTMGLCAAVAAVQSTEAHHYPFHSPPGTVPEDPANRGSVVVVIWLPRSGKLSREI